MKQYWKFLAALMLPLFLAITYNGIAATGTPYFVWEKMPATDMNGNATSLTGFTVYCGNGTRAYTVETFLPDPLATEIPVSDVVTADGDYYCALTASNSAGESAYSEEVHFFLNGGNVLFPAVPGAPLLFRLVYR